MALVRRLQYPARLGEAGGEYNDGADRPPRTGRNRLLDRRPWDCQQGGVDPFQEIIDRRHAGASFDLAAAAADEVNVAAIAKAFEVVEHAAAGRAGLRRDADDRNRSRPHQPCDVDAASRRCAVSTRHGNSPVLYVTI